MKTFVAHDNPMQALTKRYAVFSRGEVLTRRATRPAALRSAIAFCRQNLEDRLAMDPAKWPQVVRRAQEDACDVVLLEKELEKIK